MDCNHSFSNIFVGLIKITFSKLKFIALNIFIIDRRLFCIKINRLFAKWDRTGFYSKSSYVKPIKMQYTFLSSHQIKKIIGFCSTIIFRLLIELFNTLKKISSKTWCDTLKWNLFFLICILVKFCINLKC